MGRRRKGKKSASSRRSLKQRSKSSKVAGSPPPGNDGEVDGKYLPVLLEVWRTSMRVERDGAPDSVAMACERMLDVCRDLGVRFESYVGQIYDENLRVEVVEHKGDGKKRRIDSCLSPAIFINDKMVRRAQVTTQGE